MRASGRAMRSSAISRMRRGILSNAFAISNDSCISMIKRRRKLDLKGLGRLSAAFVLIL